MESYKNAYQQKGQTTDDFAAELQVYERELGYTDERRLADALFSGLRRELQTEISRRGNPPRTRKGLLQLARSIETADRLFGASRGVQVKGESPGRAGSPEQAGACRHCRSGNHASSRCPQAICFKCQEKGHYASKCQK